MATFQQQSDLVVQQVRNMSDLAEDAYRTASKLLEDLGDSATTLPLTLVNVEIGDTAAIAWDEVDTITFPTLPAVPSDLGTPPADITIPSAPEIPIEIPDQPTLAPANVEIPADITVGTVTFPDEPDFPIFDDSYLAISVTPPTQSITLPTVGDIDIVIPDQPELAAGTVDIPGDIAVATVTFPETPTFPAFDDSYLVIDTTPPVKDVTLAEVGDITIVIPEQPELAAGTVSIPGDITVGTVTFPTAPTFPEFDSSYLVIDTTPPTKDVTIPTVEEISITVPDQPELAQATVELPGDITVATVEFPTAPIFPTFDESYLNFDIAVPAKDVTIPDVGNITIAVPDQPELAPATVEIPGDITVEDVSFPTAPVFPDFDPSYLDIAVDVPVKSVTLPDVGDITIDIPDQPTLAPATVSPPEDITVAAVEFPTAPAFPTFDDSYLQIDVIPPTSSIILPDIGEVSITIPDQPELAQGTVELPGDITIAEVSFPVAPLFPEFDSTYLDISTTPPTNSVSLPTVGAVNIVIPDQPDLAPATVELPGDITVAEVSFPTAPPFPDFDPSYLDIATTPPTNSVSLPTVGAVSIVIPEQPDLAPATVELPGDITVQDVSFPVSPIFPTFDESYFQFVVDEPALGEEFTTVDYVYVEPEYTERVLAQVTDAIQRVLGGDLGLPAEYWTALWEQSANDLARQQAGRLRTIRNRGAASFWPLPSETTLAASRLIQDETARAIQLNRIERAKAAVEAARADLWKAVETGLSSEELLVGMFQQMAGRAITAAEQLLKMKIEKNNQLIALYNADIAAYAATVQGKTQLAQAYADSFNSQVSGLAQIFKAQIDGALGEIELEKAKLDAWKAKWEGYKTEGDVRISELNAKTALWTAAVDNTIKYEGLKQQTGDQEIELYKADISSYSAETSGKAQIAQAYSSSYGNQVSGLAQIYKSEIDGALGEIELEKAKLQAWTSKWEGYKVEGDVRISELEAKTKLWTSAVDNTIKHEQLKQQTGDQEIELFKADISSYSAETNGKAQIAQAYASSYGNQVSGLAQVYKAEIDGALGEIELEKAKLQAWMSKWEGYKAESDVRIGELEAKTKLWTSAVENTVKVEQTKQEKGNQEIKLFEAEISAYDAEVKGRAQIAQAYSDSFGNQVSGLAQIYKAEVDGALGEIELEKAKLDAWRAKWEGYKVESEVRASEMDANVRLWTSAVENTVKVEQVKQEEGNQQIELYKADINLYAAETSGKAQIAQAYSSSYGNQINALAQAYKSQVDGALGEIELEKAKLDAWQARWQGYKTEGDVRIAELEAKTKIWTSAVDNTVKIEQVKQETGSQEIELYKADIGLYQAETSGKAQVAQAYSSSFGNQVTGLASIYKAEIDGALSEVELEKAKLDAWKAKWEGYKTEADVRIAELKSKTDLWTSAVENTIKLEDLKQQTGNQEIELYKADISAYSAETSGKAQLAQAYSSSYGNQVSGLSQIYKAQIDGALGEIELEKSKLQAWIAQWEGYKTESEARIGELEAKAKLWTSAVENTVKIEQVKQGQGDQEIKLYEADISAYDAELRGKAQIAQAYSSSYGNQVSGLAQVYKAEIDGVLGEIELEKAKLDAWQAKWQGYKTESETRIGELEAKTKLWTASVENTVSIEQLKQQTGTQEIDLYKADISAYSAEVGGKAQIAQVYTTGYNSQITGLASIYKAKIDAALGEIELEKQKVEAWIAQWKGYEIDSNSRTNELDAKVKLWTSATENTVRAENLKLDKSKLDVEYYTAQMGKIEVIARQVAALAQGHAAIAGSQVQYAATKVDLDKAKNQIETQLTQLTQAAQEAGARLEIQQAQWLEGQGVSIQQRLAELSFGYAQAAISAADVNLSSQVGIGLNESSQREYQWDMNEQGNFYPPGV